MHERWVEVVHNSDAGANIAKDLENFFFAEPVAQTCIHKTDDATARAVFHENEDFVAAALESGGGSLDEVNNVGLIAEELVHLNFFADVGKGCFVRDRHPLENMHGLTSFGGCAARHGGTDGTGDRGRHGDGLRGGDEVNVGEAAFGKVAFHGDGDVAHLDSGTGSECALVRLLVCTTHGRHGLLLLLLHLLGYISGLRRIATLGGLRIHLGRV